MKTGHGNLTELSEADVNKFEPNVGKFSRAGSIFGFFHGLPSRTHLLCHGAVDFSPLGKSGIGQICYVVHPRLSIRPQPELLRRRKERPKSYTHPYRSAFEWSQPD